MLTYNERCQCMRKKCDDAKRMMIAEKNEAVTNEFKICDYQMIDIVVETMSTRRNAQEASTCEALRQKAQTSLRPGNWWE